MNAFVPLALAASLACATTQQPGTSREEPVATSGGNGTRETPSPVVSGGEGTACSWSLYEAPPGCIFVAESAGEMNDLETINRHIHVYTPGTHCEESRSFAGRRLVMFQVTDDGGRHGQTSVQPLSVECGEQPRVTIRQNAWCGGTERGSAFLVIEMPAGPSPVEFVNVGDPTCSIAPP